MTSEEKDKLFEEWLPSFNVEALKKANHLEPEQVIRHGLKLAFLAGLEAQDTLDSKMVQHNIDTRFSYIENCKEPWKANNHLCSAKGASPTEAVDNLITKLERGGR